ncbi:MAG: hypothetical protein GX802_06375 [Clostridiales bacterium]|nr:hypothetical protein [Clostridiales bacterium]
MKSTVVDRRNPATQGKICPCGTDEILLSPFYTKTGEILLRKVKSIFGENG